jgi:ABC-2 type transport system permease protein
MMIAFIFCGIFFGGLFSEKSAPGVSSIVISLCGVLGGAWMPLETMGGFGKICRCLPFYQANLAGRVAFSLQKADFDGFWLNIIIVSAYAAALVILAAIAFRSRMKIK